MNLLRQNLFASARIFHRGDAEDAENSFKHGRLSLREHPNHRDYLVVQRGKSGVLPHPIRLSSPRTLRLCGEALCALAVLGLTGCASIPPPPTVPRVELERFMGDWYVLGGILTPFEKGAHNAVESYALDEKGRIPTTYTFRKGGFDGPQKTFDNIAFVHNRDTFAEWRIQFFWPLKFPYLVVYLDPEYQVTAVGTDDRDYLWIMARDWQLPEERYQEVVRRVADLGFDTNRMVRVPQRWN